MRFVKAEITRKYAKCKLQSLIAGFLESDMDCAECVFEDGEYKNAASCYSSVYNAIKRAKCENVLEVFTQKGKCFIGKIK